MLRDQPIARPRRMRFNKLVRWNRNPQHMCSGHPGAGRGLPRHRYRPEFILGPRAARTRGPV